MSAYIGGSINSVPSNQTDLKGRHRCNLGGDREPTFKGEHDRWDHWADRLAGQAGRPHMSWSCAHLSWFASWSVLEPSGVVFIVDN